MTTGQPAAEAQVAGQEGGSRWAQWHAALAVFLASLCTGMGSAWTAAARERLSDHGDGPFLLKHGEPQMLGHACCAAVLAGTCTSAVLVNLAGRKATLMLPPALVVTSTFLSYFATSIDFMYAAVCCIGAAEGIALATTFVYLSEIATPDQRGKLCATVLVCTASGMALQHIAGFAMQYHNQALLALPPGMLALSLFIWTPESPYFLAMRGRTQEMFDALAKLRGQFFPSAVREEGEAIFKAVDADLNRHNSCCGCLRSEVTWKATIILILLCGAMRFTGHDTFMSNRAYFFELATSRAPPDQVELGILRLTEAIGAVLCAILVDRMGRKPLMVASAILGAGCLSTAGAFLFFNDHLGKNMTPVAGLPLVLLVTFTLVRGLGLQLPWLLLGELPPLRTRAALPALAVSLHALLGPALGDLAVWWELLVDKFVPFFVFAAGCLIMAGFAMAGPPETRGKTLAQVQAALRSKPCQRTPTRG